MCGIAGLIQQDGSSVDRDRLVRMSDAIAHRGPDGDGIWIKGPAGLAHRRLAIVDLSPTGTQPMSTEDGRLCVTFNGEIYNYQELRRDLESAGVKLRSTSDTEVLLHLYARLGEGMLEKLRGMFAFALWDADKRKLFFARDRIGKKPFFYRRDGQTLAFASELKALSMPGDKPDWNAVRLFLGLQYVPSPLTGFQGIATLPPAHYGILRDGELTIKSYDACEREPKFAGSEEEAAREVRRLLEESVKLRMIADVPVGAFLSGGVDSSAIAALMAKQSSKPIQTFTMGFPSLGYDERVEAEAFAKTLGADHHASEATPEDALAAADEIIRLYDAPYADSSAIPSWLLARETRKSVKAVMAGDGGDELFAGYRRYQYFAKALDLNRRGLSWLAINAAWMMDLVSRDPRYRRFAATLEGTRRSAGRGYGDLFTGAYFNRDDVSRLLQPDFKTKTEAADAGAYVASSFRENLGLEGALDFDLRSYLPDDLNVKMDRASMAHALEARAPFLDQALVRFAARLPLNFLLKRGTQKPLLRQALQGLVPDEIFDRPKRGFQVPLAEWFRGPLRTAFQERCLSSGSPLLTICRQPTVERYLKQNDGGSDHGNRLWMLYSLATWLSHHA